MLVHQIIWEGLRPSGINPFQLQTVAEGCISTSCCGMCTAGHGEAAAQCLHTGCCSPASELHEQSYQQDCFLRVMSSAYSFLTRFLKQGQIFGFWVCPQMMGLILAYTMTFLKSCISVKLYYGRHKYYQT